MVRLLNMKNLKRCGIWASVWSSCSFCLNVPVFGPQFKWPPPLLLGLPSVPTLTPALTPLEPACSLWRYPDLCPGSNVSFLPNTGLGISPITVKSAPYYIIIDALLSLHQQTLCLKNPVSSLQPQTLFMIIDQNDGMNHWRPQWENCVRI